jgi:hypothetical protein
MSKKNEEPENPYQSVIWDLEERASNRNTIAYVTLFLCPVIIVVGLYFFVNAFKLTNSQSVSNTFNKLRAYDSLINRSYRDLEQTASTYRRFKGLVTNQIVAGSFDKSFDKSFQTKTYAKLNGIDSLLTNSLKSLSEERTNLNSVAADSRALIEDINRFDTAIINYEYISTLTTRIGFIVILFFVLQTLIRIYRYNTKLAHFYSARADALRAQPGSGITLKTLVESLSPDAIDLGMARTSFEQVADIMKQVNQSKQADNK